MVQDIEKYYITLKLQILISNNLCLKKKIVQRIFKAFLPKNRIIPSEQRPHPLGDRKSLYTKYCVL